MDISRATRISLASLLAAGVAAGCGGDNPTEPPPDQEPQAPSASITDPSGGSSYALGQNVSFQGQADDPQDGQLSGSTLEWTSDVSGTLGTGTQITHGNLWKGQHEIVLKATDSDGNTASDTVSVTVEENTGVQGTAYAVTANDQSVGALQKITLGTGQVTRPGLLDDSGGQYTVPVAMAARPSDDQLFLWNRRDPSRALATVNRCSGRASTVALDVNVAGEVRGMAWGSNGELYLLAAKLYTVDPSTGEVLSSVGSYDSIASGGMTFDGQGRLLAVRNQYSGNELPLYELDPSTGAVTLLDSLDARIGVEALSRDEQGRIWATGYQYTDGDRTLENVVYRIDPAAADVHHIQSLNDTPPTGLSFASAPDCSGMSSPSVSITHPVDSATVGTDTAVSFQGQGTDPEDGDLAGSSLAWESSLDGSLGPGTQTSDTLSAGTHEIRLIGTDSDGHADTSQITILAQATASADTPAISAVTTPLPETQQAVVEGSNFASTPDSNSVSISGVAATVTSADSSQLTITVPDLGCIPTGTSVEISVTVAGKTSPAYGVTTEAEEAPVSLSGGVQTIRTDPSNFCLQFPESSSSSQYLVGVQSLASTAATRTPIRITSLVPGWRSSSSSVNADPVQMSVQELNTGDFSVSYDVRDVSGQDVPDSQLLELERAHRRAEREVRRREQREADLATNMLPGETSGDSLVSRQVTNPSVGDTLQLRVPDLASSDACNNYVSVTGVVEAMGTEGVIIADTAAPSGGEGGYTDQDYQDFSDSFDQRWPVLESYFGSPGDRDGNNRVVALFTPATTRGNDNLLGFVYSNDLVDRSTCPSSSEGEIFYGRVPDANISYDNLKRLIPATIQHELTHVIQYGRGGGLVSHLAEGQANLAEEISGHAVTGRQTYQNYGYDVARDPDGSDGVQWYPDNFSDLYHYFGFETSTTRIATAPEECGWWRSDAAPCVGRPLWYGIGWSFLRWVSDNYGPSYTGGEEQLHRDIIASSDVGIPKVANLVGADPQTLMARWAASLYLDDRVSGLQEGLSYSSWDLYNIVDQNTVETAHLKPIRAGFSSWYWDAEVRASSSGYMLLSGTSRPNTAVSVTTQSDTYLPSAMQVWVVKIP